MAIVGRFDLHRRQITFDYLSTETGEVRRGRIAPADRDHLARERPKIKQLPSPRP